MKRFWSCSGLVTSIMTAAGGVSAAPTVQGLTLGVERVFGFTMTSFVEEDDNTTRTTSTAGVSFGNTQVGTQAFFSVPRVAVDYILPAGLSFGGAFGFSTFGGEVETDTGPIVTQSDRDASALLFAPRVGYMLGLSQAFAFWPRAGFTYVNYSTGVGNVDFYTGFGALTFEAGLAYVPSKSFGFLATPALDLGVAGSEELDGNDFDGDVSLTEFGLTLGLFVVF